MPPRPGATRSPGHLNLDSASLPGLAGALLRFSTASHLKLVLVGGLGIYHCDAPAGDVFQLPPHDSAREGGELAHVIKLVVICERVVYAPRHAGVLVHAGRILAQELCVTGTVSEGSGTVRSRRTPASAFAR
jgi:hypothetical protein